MKKLLILLLFPIYLFGQPTYFGSVGVPTDNGTSAASPVAFANPPIASMAAGDLVVVYAYCRNASATIAVSNAGGQSWTSETAHQSSTAVLTGQVFWCRYNGTWSAAPSFSFSSTTNTNVVMHVFRPVTSTNQWSLDPGANTLNINIPRSFAAAATISSPSAATSTTFDNTVNLYFVSTDDDNTWGTPTGSGWTQVTSPSSQFRNTSGNDISSSYMYLFLSTAGSVARPSLTEATNGNDPGIHGQYMWREYTANTRNANSDFFKLFSKK